VANEQEDVIDMTKKYDSWDMIGVLVTARTIVCEPFQVAAPRLHIYKATFKDCEEIQQHQPEHPSIDPHMLSKGRSPRSTLVPR
jgi:hypothetical protein